MIVHILKEKRTELDRNSKIHIIVAFLITSREFIVKQTAGETVSVFVENKNSVREWAKESKLKLEPLHQSSSSEAKN